MIVLMAFFFLSFILTRWTILCVFFCFVFSLSLALCAPVNVRESKWSVYDIKKEKKGRKKLYESMEMYMDWLLALGANIKTNFYFSVSCWLFFRTCMAYLIEIESFFSFLFPKRAYASNFLFFFHFFFSSRYHYSIWIIRQFVFIIYICWVYKFIHSLMYKTHDVNSHMKKCNISILFVFFPLNFLFVFLVER